MVKSLIIWNFLKSEKKVWYFEWGNKLILCSNVQKNITENIYNKKYLEN